jgi:hypothetical protein
MNTRLNFNFKGERTYVQGGDIFNEVSANLTNEELILDIAFKHFTNKHCQLTTALDANQQAICVIKSNFNRYYLTETEALVTEKYVFNEEKLVAPALIEGQGITMLGNQEYSLIENIIALTKKLNYTLEPDVNGKWVFGQLKLNQGFPELFNRLNITSTRRFKGKFNENRIEIDNKYFGNIIFIVGTP